MRALSPAERNEPLRLLTKEILPGPAPNADLMHELCGKYKDDLTPSEEFMARKQNEIGLEDRRLRQG